MRKDIQQQQLQDYLKKAGRGLSFWGKISHVSISSGLERNTTLREAVCGPKKKALYHGYGKWRNRKKKSGGRLRQRLFPAQTPPATQRLTRMKGVGNLPMHRRDGECSLKTTIMMKDEESGLLFLL